MQDPHLVDSDPEIAQLIAQEDRRQADSLRLIASENYVSRAVLEATASSLTNKYAEGYPGRRYYAGMENIDPIENLAIARVKQLFGAEHANVQPYSGTPANLAILLALCEPGDTIMGLSLPAGGHLSHGWKVSATGIYYRAVQYGVHPETHLIDLDEVESLVKQHRPRLLFVGHSAYPRILDFPGFAEIAARHDCHLVADIAHIAGLIAGGVHPNPVPHCAAVSSTTHKTLRGPRGGLILAQQAHANAIDKAVFPGLQGGPHNHSTAAKAVAFHEALQPDFKRYAQQIVSNARALGDALIARGYELVTGGTDNHLLLIDLSTQAISGRQASQALEQCGIEVNANTIPNDPRKPFDPSGIRLGLAALTTRGMQPEHMPRVAQHLDDVIREAAPAELSAAWAAKKREELHTWLQEFPAPGLHF